MNEFDENLFWGDIDKLTEDFNDLTVSNYRSLFERCLNGEKVNILDY